MTGHGTALAVDDAALRECIETHITKVGATPQRIFFPAIARSNFAYVKACCDAVGGLAPSYSVKTNPRREMVAYALEFGFLAEVISAAELELAQSCGFPSDRIIYNGPRPLTQGRVLAAYADSLEALQRYCEERRSIVAGIRYRPRHLSSRFGIVESELEEAAAIFRSSGAREIALQFHVRPEDYAGHSWFEIATEASTIAKRIERLAGKPLCYLDVGGGWTPEELQAALHSKLPRLRSRLSGEFAHLRDILLEPGQGIATPVEAVATRVLEVRERRGYTEAIVDSGYPDLPQIRTFAHRIFHSENGHVEKLPRGGDRVAGSTCLEYDILGDGVRIRGIVKPGDLLFVTDAGAYDASMAFTFAQGKRRAG